jgi:hypothetical protein
MHRSMCVCVDTVRVFGSVQVTNVDVRAFEEVASSPIMDDSRGIWTVVVVPWALVKSFRSMRWATFSPRKSKRTRSASCNERCRL